MRIGFDIGGVISKYPKQFKELLETFYNASDYSNTTVYCITDMHPIEEVLDVLSKNGFTSFHEWKECSMKEEWQFKNDKGFYL